ASEDSQTVSICTRAYGSPQLLSPATQDNEEGFGISVVESSIQVVVTDIIGNTEEGKLILKTLYGPYGERGNV
ncbi:hypothetical protein STEG23_028333, partial [Scotinomys teguina]